jgi:plastocyanin
MRTHPFLACGALAVVLAASGCGGGGSSGSPSAPAAPGGGASTISIVGDNGAQSFSPNPGSLGQDQIVIWRNNDSVMHRIVLNDGTVDTGDIGPGTTSRAVRLPAAGTNYHCSIHSGMVGAIRAAGGNPAPPCTGVYC